MPFDDKYRRQVALLVRILPFVAEEKCFALKGGTAINLFYRNMPRLSVDIDLTYIPLAPRPAALKEIDAAMKRIAARITAAIPDSKARQTGTENTVTKLLIQSGNTQTKIEVTPVLRGCVYDPQPRIVSRSVEEQVGFAEILVASFADLYGGKIVAALDRQHPRDLFDVRDLFANEGITDDIRRAFLVYLISHDRPMAEVLAPTRLDIEPEFRTNFQGMMLEPILLHELLAARERLIAEIVGNSPTRTANS
ncbi:MAG TPA: nucleotidyl transferase AbiEii/AbiGii toxin family protein [Rhizomicrobium sp.]|jgi:predicted nucleotidyltransferase component of viral defense system